MLVGAVAILAFSFLVVLAPLIWATAGHYVPPLAPFYDMVTFARYAVAASVLIVALLIVHNWLPAAAALSSRSRRALLRRCCCGWSSGAAFGRYLASFAFAYVSIMRGWRRR